MQLAEETYQKLVKKFSQQDDVWVKFAEWQFKRAQVDEARELLARSMKSLDRTKRELGHLSPPVKLILTQTSTLFPSSQSWNSSMPMLNEARLSSKNW